MYEKVIFWPKTIIGEVENRFRPHYKFISSYSTNQIDIFVPICQYILTENIDEGKSVAVKLIWIYYIVTKDLTMINKLDIRISGNQIFYIHVHFLFVNPSQTSCNQTLFTQPSKFEQSSFLIRGMTFLQKAIKKHKK